MPGCFHCRGSHETVSQVRACFAAGRPSCKHDLLPNTCVTCAAWNKRRGVSTTTARYEVKWGWELGMTGVCATCDLPVLKGDIIAVRWGRRNWSHLDCFVDPAQITEPEPHKSQREPDPEWQGLHSKLTELQEAADRLIPEAISVEQDTTWRCLATAARDMDYDLAIDLVRETIYGYSLEELGAWEPREDSDYLGADEDYVLWLERQADLAWGT